MWTCSLNWNRYGSLGMMFTLPEHRGHGLAGRCVRSTCQQMSNLGFLPYTYVENDASARVFLKCGFTTMCEAASFEFSPVEGGK